MIPSLLNQGKLLWAVAPANYNGAAATHKMVCLKNYQRMYVVILTGGSAVTSRFAELIGTDGYGKTCTDAVKIADRFMSLKPAD